MPASRLLRCLPAAAAAALATLAGPSLAAARPAFGVQVDAISPTDTPAQITKELNTARALHAKAIRVEVNWSLLEPRAGGERAPGFVSALDAVVDGAAQRGIKVQLFVNRSPCWASSAPDKGDCSAPDANRFDVTRYGPTDPQSYVPVSTFLAQRYGRKLGAFEVWNEPDQANEKYWAGPNKVARYVALMKAVYRPLKQANPKLPVIAGSFVGTNGAWLKAMYDAGAQGSYDGLAVHFYDLPLYALKETRKVQLRHGDRKPLWLTEFGWTSCLVKGGPSHRADHPCVTRQMQSQALVDVLRAVSRTRWVKSAVVYQLRDESTAYQFGLLDRKGRRKPAFRAVSRALKAPRLRAPAKPTLRLRAAGGRLVASGRASITDLYTVRVSAGGFLRYRAYLRTSQRGTYRLVLPRVLGTRGLDVRITAGWNGASATRRS